MDRFRRFAALCLVALSASGLSAAARAQDRPPSLQQRLAGDLLPDGETGFLTVTSENDKYGDGSDRNYSNGLRLTWFDYGAPPPRFAYLLDEYVPAFAINNTTSTYYSFGQNLYTPEDIAAAVPDPRDRPYAAFLYVAAGLTSLTDNHIDDLELTLGVVGPAALGKQTQKFVHRLLGATDPEGWDYQLRNEPGLILSWQRQWPGAEAVEIGNLLLRATPHAGVALGNIYTYGAAGFSLQLIPTRYSLQSTPLRVRPAIPGNGFFYIADDHFAWSLFAGMEGRAVARNIFLDGNSFADGPAVGKKPVVVDLNAGFSLTYGRAQLSYTANWRSEEFNGQRRPSLFGAVSLGYRF